MLLSQNPIELNGCKFREIRCLTTREHQTALIATHPTLPIDKVAPTLFNRLQQENFFKYMLADYSLDHLVEYWRGTNRFRKESNKSGIQKNYLSNQKRTRKIATIKSKIAKQCDPK